MVTQTRNLIAQIFLQKKFGIKAKLKFEIEIESRNIKFFAHDLNMVLNKCG